MSLLNILWVGLMSMSFILTLIVIKLRSIQEDLEIMRNKLINLERKIK